MAKQRLILSDCKNNYRICKIALLNQNGEDYLKFCFPDLKYKIGKLTKFGKFKGIVINEEDGTIEFSNHFIAGVSHFKTVKKGSTKYIVQQKSNTNLSNSRLLKLLTFIIYDLKHFKEFDEKKINNSLDYKIEKNFDNDKGKILEFYLSEKTEKLIIPPARGYSDISLIKMHTFSDNQSKYRLLMIEWEFNQKKSLENGVKLHRSDNIKGQFQEINIPK